MTATKASQLTATFDAAVPADTTIEVTKGTSVIDGKSTITDSTVVFDATANLTAGTYTMTATLGETKVSKDVEVKDEYVAEIKLLSEKALTSEDTKEAYINYDVLNQYGESIRSSQTVNWTVSSSESTSVNKSSGVITIKNENGYTYGTKIYVSGVHVKSGTVFNDDIEIGMARAIDTVKLEGFLDTTEKKTILDKLPADFAKDKYVLLYRAYDQNGNEISVSDIEIGDADDAGNRTVKNLTFISDAPLLIKSEFYAGDIQTIGETEYASIKIQPGQYVDRGGEVNITVISNKTGGKVTQNFVVGNAALLKSVVLDTPSDIVADGDQNVKIPYTALDTNGNAVTNYETIVRSTNSLTLSASDNTEIVIKEENDGTAGIYWSDSASATDWSTSSAKDNISRNISISTIIAGGESSNMILEVSDTRRPNAIKAVRLSGYNDGATAVVGTALWQGFKDQYDFQDQYGKDMNRDTAVAFFAKAFDGDIYGIKRDVVGSGPNAFGMWDGIASYESNYGFWDANKVELDTAKTESIKYTIARIKTDDFADNSKKWDINNWEDVSKAKSASFTNVPISAVSNFNIQSIAKQQITTKQSSKANGVGLEDVLDQAVDATLVAQTEVKVTGTANGTTVQIPASYITTATGSAVTATVNETDNKITLSAISGGALTWSDLYDENTARLLRKDAKLTLSFAINDGNNSSAEISIAVSDAAAVATSIVFDSTPTNPTGTVLSGYTVKIYDQYGNQMYDVDYKLTVSDTKESTDALTHISNSFVVSSNGSDNVSISGAEIGDSFKITATIADTEISTNTTITVGADTLAKISSNANNSTDKTFRQAKLGYDR